MIDERVNERNLPATPLGREALLSRALSRDCRVGASLPGRGSAVGRAPPSDPLSSAADDGGMLA